MSLVAVLILLAAHTAPATAQQKAQTVSGTVLDPDGNPLIGATVVVVKGTQGAVTDAKGKFTIKAKSSDSLQISYLGYKTETLTWVRGRTSPSGWRRTPPPTSTKSWSSVTARSPKRT